MHLLVTGIFLSIPAAQNEDFGVAFIRENAFECRAAVGECQVVRSSREDSLSFYRVEAEDDDLTVLSGILSR